MNDEKLIGIREAARKAGIAHSTLSRQITRGQVRSHGGKVRLSEVLYDRKHNLDPTIWLGRKKPTKSKIIAAEEAAQWCSGAYCGQWRACTGIHV